MQQGRYAQGPGRAENVAFGAVPEVSVSQQSSVAAISVTNASGADLDVFSITLTKDYTFRPGYIKPVSCTYRGTAAPVYRLVTEAPADWSGEYLIFSNNGGKKAIILDGNSGSNISAATSTATNCIDAVENNYASQSNITPTTIAFDALTSKSAVIITKKTGGPEGFDYSIRIKSGQYIGKTKELGANVACEKGLNDIYYNKIQIDESGVTYITSQFGDSLRGRYNNPKPMNNFFFQAASAGQNIYLYRLEGTSMN